MNTPAPTVAPAMRVGIVGFGTIGSATAGIIQEHQSDIARRLGVAITVTVVCRRSPLSPTSIPRGARAVRGWHEVVGAADVDVVVETMGGTAEARDVVRAALGSGKPVVTANKNLLAE